MIKTLKTIAGIAFILAIIASCSNGPKNNNDKELETHKAEKSEHMAHVGEDCEGEEDGTQFNKTDVYDIVKKGTHLILKYDSETNSFVGTVENTTSDIIEDVRVEVHLSNSIELGLSTSIDLKAGAKVEIKIEGSEKEFETWSAHAEVGRCEHNHEGGEGEHGHDGEDSEHTHGDDEHSHGEGEHN